MTQSAEYPNADKIEYWTTRLQSHEKVRCRGTLESWLILLFAVLFVVAFSPLMGMATYILIYNLKWFFSYSFLKALLFCLIWQLPWLWVLVVAVKGTGALLFSAIQFTDGEVIFRNWRRKAFRLEYESIWAAKWERPGHDWELTLYWRAEGDEDVRGVNISKGSSWQKGFGGGRAGRGGPAGGADQVG